MSIIRENQGLPTRATAPSPPAAVSPQVVPKTSAETLLGFQGDETLAKIELSYKKLKEKYSSGWKSFQFLTSEILLEAPANWFDKYEDYVKNLTQWTQRELAKQGRSGAIAAAQADPTNDALQDVAFNTIYGITTEYTGSLPQGIEKWLIISMVSSEIIGLSKIDPLWRDREIDEIIINGPKDIQVEVKGQLRKVPAAKFRDAEHVLAMLERVFGSINKILAPSTPLVKGRLHDQSRIFAVHTAIAPDGPNVAIRRHPDKFWTPKDLVELGSMSKEIATFLGNLIYSGCSFLIIGGTSTGKTSFLNAMTGFYRNDVRLLTLEDNLEMKPNPKKMLAAAMETKEGNKERKSGSVTMRDLVKGSLQMRPDGIIIGEVTDGAAYDLAQALNTGHFGASTIHANSEYDGIYRLASLIQQGAELSQAQTLPLIAAAFDFVVLLEHFPADGSRRLVSISEVSHRVEVDKAGQPSLPTKQLYRFVSEGMQKSIGLDGKVEEKIAGRWEKVGDLSEERSRRRHLNLSQAQSWEDLVELSSIPQT